MSESVGRGRVPGAQAIAGSILLVNALARADFDEQTRRRVVDALSPALPAVVPAGGLAPDRAARPDQFNALVKVAAVAAAGLDPAVLATTPPVLWQDSGNELVVEVAGVTAQLGAGLIELTIPVRCDQTSATRVTVTFVTGSPEQPTGGLTATEDHPRGPAVIVENWHEPLVAFAWQTVLVATSALAEVAGGDFAGERLIANALAVTADGLSVLPMGRHTYARVASRR